MKENSPAFDRITSDIIGASIEIHRELGSGMLESVYEKVLAFELRQSGHKVESQRSVAIVYKGMTIPAAFRIDLLIDGLVIVEVKSMERIADIHKMQILTYLRLMKLPVGLLLNFGEATLKKGLHRIVNNLRAENSPALGVNRAAGRLDNGDRENVK